MDRTMLAGRCRGGAALRTLSAAGPARAAVFCLGLAAAAGCATWEAPPEPPQAEPAAGQSKEAGPTAPPVAPTPEPKGDDAPPAAATLTVTITGLRTDEGRVMCGLFHDRESFDEKTEPFQGARLQAKDGRCEHAFQDLPFGEYAIAVYHDLNGNDRLDKNLAGIPSEPFGFSNDPVSPLGPPSFEDAVFSVHSPQAELTVRMH